MRTKSKTGFPPTCPVCGGPMVAEFYGNYGVICKITKDGRLANTHAEGDGRRATRNSQFPSDACNQTAKTRKEGSWS
jgi:hypothetical protein